MQRFSSLCRIRDFISKKPSPTITIISTQHLTPQVARSFSIGQKAFASGVAPKPTTSTPLSSKALVRQEHRKNYTRDGYVVIKNLFAQEEMNQLRDDLVAMARGRYGEFEGFVPADGQLKDNEVVATYSRIEYPHKISPMLYDLAMANPKMVEVLNALIGPNIKCMSTKMYVQGPGDRGRLWHQGEHLIPTRDASLLCAIIALDDHTIENGCPLMHPGSHRSRVLFRLRQPGQTDAIDEVARVNVENADDVDDEDTLEAFDVSRDPDAGVPIELTAGSVVFVNGYTLQRMLPNTSSYVLRRALKIHYCSAESWLPWNMDGKVPLTADNRDIVMIAGEDPYAYKGITPLGVPRGYPKIDPNAVLTDIPL